MLILCIERRIGPALAARVSAEDVLQETLLAAWQDRAAFQGGGPPAFRNWILTIAEFRICRLSDHFGAQKRGGGQVARTLEESKTPDGIPHSVTPSRVAWYREQATAVRAALDSLHDDVREIVRLRLVEQLTVEAIAAQMGVGESLVRHRFRKGAEQLRFRVTGMLGSRSEFS